MIGAAHQMVWTISYRGISIQLMINSSLFLFPKVQLIEWSYLLFLVFKECYFLFDLIDVKMPKYFGAWSKAILTLKKLRKKEETCLVWSTNWA